MIFVAPTAKTTNEMGKQKKTSITATSPLTLVLKTPNVKMHATASQTVHVEMVFDSSVFITFSQGL